MTKTVSSVKLLISPFDSSAKLFRRAATEFPELLFLKSLDIVTKILENICKGNLYVEETNIDIGVVCQGMIKLFTDHIVPSITHVATNHSVR